GREQERPLWHGREGYRSATKPRTSSTDPSTVAYTSPRPSGGTLSSFVTPSRRATSGSARRTSAYASPAVCSGSFEAPARATDAPDSARRGRGDELAVEDGVVDGRLAEREPGRVGAGDRLVRG